MLGNDVLMHEMKENCKAAHSEKMEFRFNNVNEMSKAGQRKPAKNPLLWTLLAANSHL